MDFGWEHFHASGKFFKESDDRGMQFAAETSQIVEDSIFRFRKWKSTALGKSLVQINIGPPLVSRIPIFPKSKRSAPGRAELILESRNNL